MASKFTFEFDITNLLHVKTTKNDKDGNPVKCLIIPIEKNHMELNFKKDGFIIRGTMSPVKTPVDGGRTHVMRLSVPKGIYAAMTDKEKEAVPWLGSAKEWKEEVPAQGQPPVGTDFSQPEEDDLPF